MGSSAQVFLRGQPAERRRGVRQCHFRPMRTGRIVLISSSFGMYAYWPTSAKNSRAQSVLRISSTPQLMPATKCQA